LIEYLKNKTMKKILLIILIINISFKINAQCVSLPSCTATAQYCTIPSNNGNLQIGYVGVPYSGGIKLFTQISTQWISVPPLTAISGLPPELSYNVSPSGLVVNPPLNGGSLGTNPFGCFAISGTPTTSGMYTLSLTFTLQSTGGSYSTINRTYYLIISPSVTTDISYLDVNSSFLLSPNPANTEIVISSDTYLGKIVVMDALGKSVLEIDGNYYNQKNIDVSTLKNGLYFLQANDGERIITKKFLKN
jgi:hypothetical protein